MQNNDRLSNIVHQVLGELVQNSVINHDELTIEVNPKHIRNVMDKLKGDKSLLFNQLIDLCGVDYLLYGEYDWETEAATEA